MKLSLKKAVTRTAGATLLAALASNTLAGVTVSPMVGQILFDNDLRVENTQFASLGLGYDFDSPWGVELTYLGAEPDFEQINADMDYYHLRLDALYHFNRDEDVQPYLVFGAGEQTYDVGANEPTSTLLNAGMGLKAKIKGGLNLRTDLRLLNDPDEELTGYAVGLGLLYEFGAGSSPAPMAAAPEKPSDSDYDGVADSDDRCPGTPTGATVDAYGCVLNTDEDGDGIANDMDKCPDTKTGAKVDATGCYIIITETKTVNMEVPFASNSSDVPVSSYSQIEAVAQFMTQFPLTKVFIEGHTDDSGSAAYNKKLSQKRSEAVAQVLINQFGIEASRVGAIGYGEEQPIVANDTPANRAKNRRVTAKVSAQVDSIQQ